MSRFLILALAGGIAAAPATAETPQTPVEPPSGMEEGLNLLEEGTRLLFKGLMAEIGPALEDLEGKIIDLNKYRKPEILPNGDIIIRRKTPLELEATPPPEGQIDL